LQEYKEELLSARVLRRIAKCRSTKKDC